MNPELREYKVDKPFCGFAEPWYYRDLLQRAALKKLGQPDPGGFSNVKIFRYGETVTVPGKVVWKRRGYCEPTGLCISGEMAGFLVSQSKYPRIGRPLFVDGGKFDSQRAQDSLKFPLSLTESMQSTLKTVMAGADLVLPNVLVRLMKYLQYPVDANRFLGNVRRENLQFVEPVQTVG